MKPAAVPIMFTKPADALTGPYDDVEVHECAQPELDYEAELTVILARDAKNVPEDQALDYVLGYTVGNDLSARNYQKPDMSGGQFCYAKSFDGFAPIGPSVTLASAIKDPQKLKLSTTINGSVRQQSSTDDMIWSVKQIIAHLSKGTTLRKGTVIMTGTPGGVGIFMEPKGYLKHGEVAEITLEGVGSILNKMVFV
jgi:transcription initiation factor TFIIH subunit 2